MHRLLILMCFLTLFISAVHAQTEITWETLTDVRYTDKYYEEEREYYLFPHFGDKVKALEGKEVFLKGFILAIYPQEGYYLLSSNPYASCFFCGNAGPETVVELNFTSEQDYLEMDQLVTIKGKLKLNDNNIYQCNYIFEEPELYDPD